MALNIMYPFNELNAIHDAFSCYVRTDSYVLSPRNRAGADIAILSTNPVENTLQINVFDDNFNFQAFDVFIRFTPNPTEVYDIPIAPHPNAPTTFPAIQERILQVLDAQAAFALFFNYEKLNNDKVQLTSKADDTHVFVNVLNPFTANVVFQNITTFSSPPIFREDFKILVNIAENQGSFYTNLAQQEIIPSYSDIVWFQNFAFAEIHLAEHFKNRFDMLPLNLFNNGTLFFGLDPNMSKTVKVSLMEVYDNDFQEGMVLEPVRAIDAGSNHTNRNGRNAFVQSIANGRWLHHDLKQEQMRHQANVLCCAIPADVSFRIQLNYATTNTSGIQTHTKSLINANNKVRFIAIPTTLEALFPISLHNILEELTFVDVKIIDTNDNNLFQAFHLDINHSLKNYRHYIFQNSFGVWQGVVAHAFSFEVESQHGLVNKPFSMFDGYKDGNRININRNVQQEITASFDFQLLPDNFNLLDFIESQNIYEIIDQEWVPMVLDKNKIKIGNHLDNLAPFEFKYQYATINKVRHV